MMSKMVKLLDKKFEMPLNITKSSTTPPLTDCDVIVAAYVNEIVQLLINMQKCLISCFLLAVEGLST